MPAGTGSAGSAPAPDARFPADPYPGFAPSWSYVHLDARSHPLAADPAAFAGWRVGGTDLDDWLADHGGAPMAGRVPVLAFGSNRCPSKITWLREHLGLAGPVVMLRARLHGLAAVWAAGHRARDGVRPASLMVTPPAVEVHAVWMATPEQIAVLDVCEGRGERYDLVRLHAGRVVTEDGAVVDDPWTYWPAAPMRAPLLVDGVPIRCSELHQDRARDLVGAPADLDGAPVTVQSGPPDPDCWPSRVFAYGTLQPGTAGWPLMAPHVRGAAVEPAPAWLPGRVHDTGRGYPALTLARSEAGDAASGTVLTLPDVASAMAVLDEYEGPEYRRVRSVTYRTRDGASGPAAGALEPTGPGSVCWLWVWDDAGATGAWPVMSERWGAGGT